MFTKVWVDDAEGEGQVELVLPAKYEVCWRCEGKGVHDCWEGGMTGDEMAEQGPDFFDDYMSGMYDTQCSDCKGQRVLLTVSRDECRAEDLVLYERHLEQEAAYQAEIEAERRFGY